MFQAKKSSAGIKAFMGFGELDVRLDMQAQFWWKHHEFLFDTIYKISFHLLLTVKGRRGKN